MNELVKNFKEQALRWESDVEKAKTGEDRRISEMCRKSAYSKLEMAEIFGKMLDDGYVFDRSGHEWRCWNEIEEDSIVIGNAISEEMFVDEQLKDVKSDKVVCRIGTIRQGCSNCGESYFALMLDKVNKKFFMLRREKRPVFSEEKFIDATCIYSGGIKPYSIEIDVPSGKMLIANVLHKWYDWVKMKPEYERLQYSHEYSVNYKIGQKNYSEKMALLNCASFNVGNCSCDMFQTNSKKDRFIVGDCGLGNRKGYIKVGNVCTDFWGYYIVDRDDFISKAGRAELVNENPRCKDGMQLRKLKTTDHDVYEIDCVPGRYKFTHKYHLIEGDDTCNKAFTHIRRVK